MAEDVRAAAVEIVLAEKRARGHAAEALPGTHLEKVYGCDILSRVPGEEEPCRIEVKGWGTPLIAARGGFHWPLELQVSQRDAARSGVPFRVEIVANLRAYLDRGEPHDRLTVDGGFIAENAIPNGYSVVLDPLRGARRSPKHQVLLSSRLRVDDVPRADAEDGSDELPYAQALIGAIRNCLATSPGATPG